MSTRADFIFLRIVAALCIMLGASSHCPAQDWDVGASCAPRQLCFFPSTQDSLHWWQEYQRLLALDSTYAATRNESLRAEYREESVHAAKTLLAFTDSVLQGDPHPALAVAYETASIALQWEYAEKKIRYSAKAAEILHALYPCETHKGNAITADLTMLYHEAGDLEQARDIGSQNLTHMQNMPVVDSAKLAFQHIVLGTTYRILYQEGDALLHFHTALELQRALGDSTGLLDALYWLGGTYESLGQYREAEDALLEHLAVAEALYAPLTEAVISARSDLADFYYSTAQINTAEQLVQDVVERLSAPTRREAPPGKSYRPSAGVTPATESLFWKTAGLIAMDRGSEDQIAFCNEQSMLAARRITDPQARFSAVAVCLIFQAVADMNRLRYAAAMRSLDMIDPVLDSLSEESYPIYSSGVLALKGSIESEGFGRHARADTLLQEAIRQLETEVGSEHPAMIPLFTKVAGIRRERGMYNEAVALARRARRIAATVYPDTHPFIGRLESVLAKCELDAGQLDSADLHIRGTLEIFDTYYDPRHPMYLNALHTAARLVECAPDDPDAADIMRRLTDATIARVQDAFAFEGEEQQVRIHHHVGMRSLSTIARWALQEKADRRAPEILFDAALALKGAVLSENIRLNRAMRTHSEEQHLSDTLMQLRERYSTIATRKVEADEFQAVMQLRDQLRSAIDSLDALLRQLNSTYRRSREIDDADWRDIRRSLDPDEALIEYLAVEDSTGSEGRRYLALVLRPKSTPVLVDLCPESAIEQAAQTSIDERTVSLMPEHSRMNALAGLVFAPLLPQLDGVTTLTVVPDGVLHRLSFAALPVESPTDSTTFLDERFVLRQLVRSRDLLSETRGLNRFVSPSSSRILLIGNPAFTARNDGVSSYTVRGWQDLPGTEKEVDDLAALCEEFGVTAVTMQRGEASEKAFKHLSGDAPRVLHLATHGYFYPVRPPREGSGGTSKYRYARGRTAPAFRGDPDEGDPDALRGRGTIAAEGHPLLRSGLILAGANAAWSGQPVDESGNDGILTAMEVSQLDFEKTELVVLSACETALGDIRTGEGVFGLQRAFLAAGVSSLVMSLWKVSDQATAEFMQHFYRSWLSGVSKRDALREARRQLREQYADPQIWAAFVLVGT